MTPSSQRSSSSENPSDFPWPALIVLSAAVFMTITAEFLPTGLLPEMSRSLEVSEAQIGLLVTIFAGTVVVSSIALTALTRRFSRKLLLLVALAVMSLSNVVGALAPDFDVLIGARVLGGIAHGLFFSLANAYASYMVAPQKLGKAIAVLNTGGTMAFVMGVPLGTALGNAVGWRWATATVAVAVAILLVLMALFLPTVKYPSVSHEPGVSRSPLKDPSLPAVLAASLIVVLVMAGHNAFYVYIAPFLIDSAGFSVSSVSLLLFLYGGAGALGVVFAGIAGDRAPHAGLIAMIVTAGLGMVGLTLTTEIPPALIALLVIWAAAFGGLPPLVQLRALRASSVPLRDVTGSILVTAFNIGIGGGALLGAVLFDVVGVAFLALIGAGILGLGLIVTLLSRPPAPVPSGE